MPACGGGAATWGVVGPVQRVQNGDRKWGNCGAEGTVGSAFAGNCCSVGAGECCCSAKTVCGGWSWLPWVTSVWAKVYGGLLWSTRSAWVIRADQLRSARYPASWGFSGWWKSSSSMPSRNRLAKFQRIARDQLSHPPPKSRTKWRLMRSKNARNVSAGPW